jgi:endonuclease/exonuclease/phosphatase family metal-dependent hydrolase
MDLSLISCNIRFDNPADGQNSWDSRRDFLAQTLLLHQPVIVATQEGRMGQLQELENLLEMELVDQHRSWIKERMYPSFYIKRGYFEFLASGDLWLSETPEIAGSKSFNSAFPRLMTWVHLQLKNSTQQLLLVNTHLDHIKISTRLGQMKVLAKEIKRIWHPSVPLIIMGDFNDSPFSPVREQLLREFNMLTDAWQLFNEKEESSHHAFQGEIQNGSRIDWILTDRRLHLSACWMDKSSQDGMYPTDHFPVVCKLKL